MCTALNSAFRGLGNCKKLQTRRTANDLQALAAEKQFVNHFGSYVVPSPAVVALCRKQLAPLTEVMGSPSNAPKSSGKHHPLTYSNSVTTTNTTNFGRNSSNREHRRLDRSASEPVAQQQQPRPAINHSSRYKTELCRPFEENGACKYGDKCQFAHGINELRNLARHPKYKTELCRTFHTSGFCPYGPRCHFIHNDFNRGLINTLQQSGNINIPNAASSNIESLLGRALPSMDVHVGSFSLGSAGDLSPNSSSISGSPTSCNGFSLDSEETVGVFSPVPQTAPAAMTTKNAFFGQDFVPCSLVPASQQKVPAFAQRLLACHAQAKLMNSGKSLDAAMDELSLDSKCNLCRPTSSNDSLSKLRLPIFSRLAFGNSGTH